MNDFRAIPSVEQLLQMDRSTELADRYGRPLLVEAIRSTLAEIRTWVGKVTIPDRDGILEQANQKIEQWVEPGLVPVINASGVVLHTNLGRAPLSRAAVKAIEEISAGYSTLEYDLKSGKRGSRSTQIEGLLQRLTGAEAALVVNNNAGAVLLALSALAKRQRVIISRTQLVEIGGGFRVPDVMSQSGTKLVEIGATNRVHLEDYEKALEDPAAFVLHVHSSNFRIIGFTSEPALRDLVVTAHARQVLMMDDLGSGALLNTEKYGLAHEPTVQESIAAGADLVCFSGDKLLGGPQAGIIIGRADLLAKIKKHPLARALRADKLCLAGLSATLLHYLKDEAETEIPVWRMISRKFEDLRYTAEVWKNTLEAGEVIGGLSTVGGGSLPEETLPTALLALTTAQPNRMVARMRALPAPIIARVEDHQVVLDPRTVLPEQEGALLMGLRSLLNSAETHRTGKIK
jgi:L-seryl-tRNA(Ser) seleniumtransferase